MEMRVCIGADAARLCARRATEEQRALIRARAEQLAAVDDLAARNAHYDVLWDLVVDGSGNIAYRLALTTLVERQRVAALTADALAAELRDDEAVRALTGAIAAGDEDGADARARALLDRSIPGD
jgi:DNA-binding FadR family transcriptional regulator